jgi:hypothetical protein
VVKWQITAKTIFCNAVDDEVTVIVSRDGTARCTGSEKYSKPSQVTHKLTKEKSRRLKRQIKCEDPQCNRLTQYRDQIFNEETGNAGNKTAAR